MSIEKFKSLLQMQWAREIRQTSVVWFPTVLVTVFALTLWAYLVHPEWIEGTVEENASTGELLSTDPTSPVTEADLSLNDLASVAEAESVSSILEQVSLSASEETDEDLEENPEEDPSALLAGEAVESARSDSPTATQEGDSKPNVEANNPFASSIQAFLNGNRRGRGSRANDAIDFAPILAVFQDSQDSSNALQQTLSNSNETGEPSEEMLLPSIGSTTEEANSTAPSRSAQNSSPRSSSGSSLAGPVPYIPGQIPSVFPGRTPSSQPANSGFINPVPGGSTYYPTQRGTGGYQVTPGGTTYQRTRGNTGSVVTPQGIIGPRQRGSTGSVVTPEGTIYQRQRGTTGFTAPPSPNVPNSVQPSPFGN